MTAHDSWLMQPLHDQEKQELDAEAKEAQIREDYKPGGEFCWDVEVDGAGMVSYILATASDETNDAICAAYQRELSLNEEVATEVFQSGPDWLVMEIAKRDPSIMTLLEVEYDRVVDTMVNREFGA